MVPIRVRPRPQGPLDAQRSAELDQQQAYNLFEAQRSGRGGAQRGTSNKKGPVIAGALVVIAVISVAAMFAFSSGGDGDGGAEAPRPSLFRAHSVAELAGYLPSQAPDGWTATAQSAAEQTALADGLGPENGSSPVDPSTGTNPSGCAQPIKPDSVTWAAKATFTTNEVNTVTNLPDSVVIMVGVQRSGADAIAEYRDSLSAKCLHYTYTDPKTSSSVAVRQELLGNKSFPDADTSLGVKVSQDENRRRTLVDWTTVALKHDVVIKTMASEYNSTDLADTSTGTMLRKISRQTDPAPASK